MDAKNRRRLLIEHRQKMATISQQIEKNHSVSELNRELCNLSYPSTPPKQVSAINNDLFKPIGQSVTINFYIRRDDLGLISMVLAIGDETYAVTAIKSLRPYFIQSLCRILAKATLKSQS